MDPDSRIVVLPSRSLDETPLHKQIADGLSKPSHQRTLPTMLLYDEPGLRLYDEITTKAPEYYLFPAEEQILKDHASDIVKLMHNGAPIRDGEVMLELGAGALRKTRHLLKALADYVGPKANEPIPYLALDLELNELKRTLSEVETSELGELLAGRVQMGGLCGTYDDGIDYVRSGALAEPWSPVLSPVEAPPEIGQATLLTPPLNEDTNRCRPTCETQDAVPGHGHIERDEPSPTLSSFPSDTSSSEDLRDLSYSTTPPLHLLFLGSSIGNFEPDGAAAFLRSLPLRPWVSLDQDIMGDTLLLGLDHDNDASLIEVAYNDPAGHTRGFIMNGLRKLRDVITTADFPQSTIRAFDPENWDYHEKYDTLKARHEGSYQARKPLSLTLPNDINVDIEAGERIHIESSYKYSEEAALRLFNSGNLVPVNRWTSASGLYSLWLLRRPTFNFPIAISKPVSNQCDSAMPTENQPKFPTIPTLNEWQQLWSLWDTVTLGMIPPGMMHQKPIDLRHKCLFYLGHIPAFLDIHLSRLLSEPHSKPEYFKDIFERGIDPHVSDPTQCHAHSEVPTDDNSWPSLEDILDFRDRVRARLQNVYALFESGDLEKRGLTSARVQRVMWMTYEHEAFHLETLLYMLLQKAGEVGGTRPPPGIPTPDWSVLSKEWRRRQDAESKLEAQVVLGPATLYLGHDDPESAEKLGESHEFGWDNEHPRRQVSTGKFKIDRLPITNGQYLEFFKGHKDTRHPASWVLQGDEYKVRTVFGLVPMTVAKDWPLMASYNELEAFATSKGGRIPTEPELRLFMDYQETQGEIQSESGWGFKRWHPVPGSLGNPDRKIAPHNGGVWEWTSTLFDTHEGFKSSILYPGYSADFFDGFHNVVLGGSWATLPRLAQRRSLRNWYQRDYPYAWIGARIVYDC